MSDIDIEPFLMNSLPQAVIATDLSGKILSWNRAAEEMYGWPAADVLGRLVSDITVAEPSLSQAEQIMNSLRNGKTWEGDFPLRRRDGTTFAGHVVDTGIYDDSGQLLGIIGVSTNIGDRKDVEDLVRKRVVFGKTFEEVGSSLAASRHIDELTQRLTDAATALTGAKYGAFFYHNGSRAGAEQSDLSIVSGIPRSASAGFPIPPKAEVFAPAIEGWGSVRIGDLSSDPRNGATAPSDGLPQGDLPARSYLAVPVRRNSGEPLGGLLFAHEEPNVFTELDEQIAETIASWTGLAFENARAFEELEHARDEVARLNRFKDNLLELVSHEFRTPVTTLAGLADFLGRRGQLVPQGELIEICRSMTEAADRLRHLVENTLVLARVESEDAVSFEPVLVQRVVNRIVESWRQKHPEHAIIVAMEGELPAVNGSESLLALVVENLLSNALKFSPAVQPVEVRVWEADAKLCAAVQDGGEGMTERELLHAFEPFVRFMLDTAGAGLGLAVCKRIIELHQGDIVAENRPDSGLEVRFELPILDD